MHVADERTRRDEYLISLWTFILVLQGLIPAMFKRFFFPFRNKLELLCWVVVTSSLATESGPFDALERPLSPKENIFFYY